LIGEVAEEVPLSAAGKSTDYRNYYLPHCAAGATYCYAYQKFTYSEPYSKIDMEVRATEQYAKFYFVIKPGGSPSDIEFEFEGQNSINVNPYLLELFYGSDILEIPNAIAYQEHNGTITPMTWAPAFVNQGNGKVSFNIGSYDNTKNLIIQMGPPLLTAPPSNFIDNIDWVTHIGSTSMNHDYIKDVKNDANGNVYITGSSGAVIDFPLQNQVLYDPIVGKEAFSAKFNSDDEILWYNLFGTYGEDEGTSLVVTANEEVIVTGTATSIGFSTSCIGSAYCDEFGEVGIPLAAEGTSDIFFFKFAADGASYSWMTYYGSDVTDDYVSDLLLSDDNKLILLGKTKGNNFPTYQPSTSAYYDGVSGNPQGTWSSPTIGFISEFDIFGNLEWSTYFGTGSSISQNDCTVEGGATDEFGNLFIWGAAGSPGVSLSCSVPINNSQFPICDISGNSDYTQTTSSSGFIAKFTSRNLAWSTFFNGIPKKGWVESIENSSDLYLAGELGGFVYPTAAGSCNISTNSTSFPLCNTINAIYQDVTPNGGQDIFLAKFGGNNNLEWSTYYGGSGDDYVNDFTMRDDKWIYFTGATWSTDFPTKQGPGTYNKGHELFNNDTDMFVSVFDQNLNESWATYLGGGSQPFNVNREQGWGISVYNDNLYVVGATNEVFLPNVCSSPQYCRSNNVGNELDEGIIFRFDLGLLPTSSNNLSTDSKNSLLIYPNPNEGQLSISTTNNFLASDVLIYNQTGQIIQEYHNIFLSESSKTLNIDFLVDGFYILQIRNINGEVSNHKFLKQ
jgi:hypothetical protein